jgi:hypothetical protein
MPRLERLARVTLPALAPKDWFRCDFGYRIAFTYDTERP